MLFRPSIQSSHGSRVSRIYYMHTRVCTHHHPHLSTPAPARALTHFGHAARILSRMMRRVIAITGFVCKGILSLQWQDGPPPLRFCGGDIVFRERTNAFQR